MIGLRATNFAEVVVGDRGRCRWRGGLLAVVSVLTRAKVPQRPDGGTGNISLPPSLGWAHGCTPAVPQRRARRAQHRQERRRDRHRASGPVELAHLRAPGPKHGGLGSGVEGDFLGDTRHHGGDYQAVYAFAREELDWWAAQLGRDLPNGMFGENLTTSGLDVDGALVGERWAVGDEVVLEVCGPRIPCATFAARMGERGWVKRFSEVGRTGAYLSVVTPAGRCGRATPIEVVSAGPTTTSPCPTRSGRSWATSTSPSGCWRPTAWSRSEAAELRETVARRRIGRAELD